MTSNLITVRAAVRHRLSTPVVSCGGLLLALLGPPLLLSMSAAAGVGTPVFTTLVKEGDAVSGVGNVLTIDNIAINASGVWMVEVDTNAATNDGVLLRNGVNILRDGDALAPNPATLSSFDSITINDHGEGGHNFFLANTGSAGTDSGVYFIPGATPYTPALVYQESNVAPNMTAGTPFIGWFDVKINNARQLLLVSSVDDINLPTSVDRALHRIQLNVAGAIVSTTLIAAEGDTLAGQTEKIADFSTGPHATAIDDAGNILFLADLEGDTLTDGVIYRNGTLIAQEGSASPVAGRNWSGLASSRMDINTLGGYVHTGTLAGDAATDTIIIRNGAKFMQEGDAPPDVPGGFAITSFGAGPVEIANNGDVLWYADWNDANTAIDEGLYLGDQLLIQEGVTVVDGQIVDIIRFGEDAYHMSDDGSHIIVELQLADGTEGAFTITFVSPCPADINNDNTVNVTDLLAVIGAWSATGPNPADVNADGTVNITDLLAVIGAWGACP